jgi:hypothetical protein
MLRAVAVGTAMMLTAAGCKNDTPSAPINKETPVPVFTGITDLQTYLEGQGETAIDKPIAVRLSVNLSEQETSTENLFAALAAAGKYVDLDLSGCTGLTEWVRYTDAGADRVVSLVLPDSVAEIEGTADAFTFASFASLKAFTANKAETVGAYAFYRHAALKTAINLPAATVIGEWAFHRCSALASANLPAAVTIKAGAFNFCTALASISLPSAVTIKAGAFNSCAALASVSLPKATAIEANAFNFCAALETASLPAATAIEANAFYRCAALASINLPETATIGDEAFRGCAALASADLPKVTTIGANAFYGCAALASVNIPAATVIGEGAFAYTALALIELPAAAAVIGEGAFVGCANLTDIRVSPDNQTYSVKDGMLLNKAGTTLAAYPSARDAITLSSVTTVGAYAFQGCAALASVNLPAATTIGTNAFYSCTALASTNLPATTAIGASAFRNCYALASLTLGTVLPTLGNTTVFYDAGKDTSEGFTVYVPDETAKTAIDTSSDWYTALKDTSFVGIYHGKFKGVAVAQ